MPKYILVVDDDVNIRTAVRLRLERDALAVRVAEDIAGALRQIAAQPPELVILDLNLPGGDGLDLLAHLKGSPGLASIPVIVLTGRYLSRDDYPLFLEASAEVIAKPFSPRYLAQRVHALLAAQPAAPPQRPLEAGEQPPSRPTSALSSTTRALS